MGYAPGRAKEVPSERLGFMKKIKTINRNRDFNRIYAKGKSYVTSKIVIYVQKNRDNETRIGITASKKIGNAVQRNRAKRVIREACREMMLQIKPGYDIVLVARKRTVQVKSGEVKNALTKMLAEANILKEVNKKEGKRICC